MKTLTTEQIKLKIITFGNKHNIDVYLHIIFI
jgi:hypothetical protein